MNTSPSKLSKCPPEGPAKIEPAKGLFQKIGLNHPIFTYKTKFDKSELSCLENVLMGTVKSFALGYGIKATIGLIFALLNLKNVKKNPKVLLKALLNQSNLRLGLFMSIKTCLLKSVIVLSRILTKKDSPYSYVLGGFAGAYFSSFLY